MSFGLADLSVARSYLKQYHRFVEVRHHNCWGSRMLGTILHLNAEVTGFNTKHETVSTEKLVKVLNVYHKVPEFERTQANGDSLTLNAIIVWCCFRLGHFSLWRAMFSVECLKYNFRGFLATSEKLLIRKTEMWPLISNMFSRFTPWWLGSY